jgi:putative transcriptional regulator
VGTALSTVPQSCNSVPACLDGNELDRLEPLKYRIIEELRARRADRRIRGGTSLSVACVSAGEVRPRIAQALFAKYLRTNVRTLENWEQGRARPNALGALSIRIVERYPDTVKRLAKI